MHLPANQVDAEVRVLVEDARRRASQILARRRDDLERAAARLLERESGLPLPTVPVLYDGPFDETILRRLHTQTDENGDEAEGWVMRVADAFAYRDFPRSVAKMARAGHVAEHAQHWRRGPIIENELRKA